MLFRDDDPDVEIRDPGDITHVYDHTLRHPAPTIADRFPILTGFEAGASIDVIAASIAAGCRWATGPASKASGPTIIWLSPIDMPYDRQVAAWWLGKSVDGADRRG